MVQTVPDRFDFPKSEEDVLKLWKDVDAFQISLKLAKGRPRYSFYDGPPFATGLPHYGHILAGTIKDTVTRWASMNGYFVERRFGWDCHGLPVEYEIDKSLNIKSPEDVTKMGIAAYNQACRNIVMRYSSEWETIITRLGRWIDFHNDYKTMYPWFMESIWWVFKQLFEKGLVYKGFKVMPFSTGCHTPLSNFEAGQNYKDVNDPAVIISFPILTKGQQGASFLAWTTTPWTLPSNLALCVNPHEVYVKISDKKRDAVYILMEKRLVALYNDEKEYAILQRYQGNELSGFEYEPLFEYFKHRKGSGAFRVFCDGYVTDASGTGIVHQAPYFGEDDYRVCLANGIISKDGEVVCPVDDSGMFVDPVVDFSGQYVKDADKNIIKDLKDRGRLVDHRTHNHSYPFCWRSETPLIYKAVPSWFVRVESLVDKLLDNNGKTYWVPDFVKEKRFANWLRDARDWAISRNRYWGTPIPVWVSSDGEEVVCVGSIEELAQLTERKPEDISDLHREFIDPLTIPSKCGKGELHRITEVFDCWFESGSMPYAQQHYPFEHKKEFEDSFPADFIGEGIDQTRGWFYTLLVLSTALFDQPPFKNLIANGLILASDGQKMSKRKKNYPDPTVIVNKFGADALRLYLINSPAVRGDALRFKEEGVQDILKDVFLPWFNAYRFLVQNIERLSRDEGIHFSHSEDDWTVSTNYMDRWILSFTQSLIKFVREEMTAYRLYTVLPRLVKFVDHLTNWYVRMNRGRLKGDCSTADCLAAVETLFVVLYAMVKVMAPFTPFLSENFYQNLHHVIKAESTPQSVHFLSIPEPREDLIDANIEAAVSKMQSVIELGRVIRDRKTLPTKYPLKEIVIVLEDLTEGTKDLLPVRDFILDELNIKDLMITNDKAKFGVKMEADVDHKALGARLKSELAGVAKAVKAFTDAQIEDLKEKGSLKVNGHVVELSEVRIRYAVAGAASHYEANADRQVLVLIDCSKDDSSEREGLAREVINRIQKLRKEAGLQPNNDITIYFESDSELNGIITQQIEFITATTKQPLVPGKPQDGDAIIVTKRVEVKDFSLNLCLAWRGMPPSAHIVKPKVELKYCNVECNGKVASVVLENPVGSGRWLTYGNLCSLIKQLFDLKESPSLFTSSGPLSVTSDITELKSQTVTVCQTAKAGSSKPACPILFASNADTTIAVVTENPLGEHKLDHSAVLLEACKLYKTARGVSVHPLQLYGDIELARKL